MKLNRVAVFASAILMVCSVPVFAQFSITKEDLEAIAKKAAEEKGAASGGKRAGSRGGGAAAGGTGQNFAGWGSLKDIQAQNLGAAKPQQEKLSFASFGSFAAGGGQSGGAIRGAINRVIKKQITVIDGDRVVDAVTGELLDDARKIRVDEDKKEEFYDDGTHGDLVAGDGQYTRVNKITDVIGPNNQRIKEQLIQAVYEISRLDPVEFYGHTLASVDHESRPERYKRWALVDAKEGNVGFRISEIGTEKSVTVPNYWEEQLSRDMKVAGPNGWARSFLDEYRVTKGGIDSNFYTPYVPQPPTIPAVPPPSAEGWTPFVEVYSEEEGIGVGSSSGKAGTSGGKLDLSGFTTGSTGKGAAARFVNRGAGQGSTQGGYFSAE